VNVISFRFMNFDSYHPQFHNNVEQWTKREKREMGNGEEIECHANSCLLHPITHDGWMTPSMHANRSGKECDQESVLAIS
jgi:hypothetical protein